jgi:DUF2905 family protein
MEPRSTGTLLIGVGLLVVVVGVLVWTGAFSWFGRLPGDIRIERDGVRIYVPLTSMILVSVALSLLSYLARRLL